MGSLLIQRFRLRKLARVRVPGGSESFQGGGRVCARGGSIMNAHRLANRATMLSSNGAKSPQKTEVKIMTTFENESNKTLRAEDMNGARIELLTDWTDFEACEHIANNAIIKAYSAHKFKFATNAPTSGADMFDAMPYTSTSDYAAAWWCNCTCYNTLSPSWHFVGVALAYTNDYTQPRAVLVWRIFNDDGEEVRDVYEVAGDSVGTVAEIAEARDKLRAEIKTARGNATTRAQVAALACENLRAAFSAFSGRQYGEATAAKMRAAFKDATGGALTFYPVRAYNSARAYRVMVQRLTPEGYTTPNGEEIEIWRDACGDGARDFINEANTIQGFGREELRAAYLRAAEPWTKDTAAALTVQK